MVQDFCKINKALFSKKEGDQFLVWEDETNVKELQQ